MIERNSEVREGDVIEFTLRGERRTAEAMLLTDDGLVLLDLFDGDRLAWAQVSILADVAVFAPDGSPSPPRTDWVSPTSERPLSLLLVTCSGTARVLVSLGERLVQGLGDQVVIEVGGALVAAMSRGTRRNALTSGVLRRQGPDTYSPTLRRYHRLLWSKLAGCLLLTNGNTRSVRVGAQVWSTVGVRSQ